VYGRWADTLKQEVLAVNPIARAAWAAVLCVPALTIAQAPDATPQSRAGQQPHSPEEAFRRADTNSDGKVSFDEIRARRPNLSQSAFDRMDTNGDGFLTGADRPEGGRAATRGNEGESEARRQMLDKLMQSDSNADGQVSYDEIAAAKPGFARADFDRLDRNSDGFVSRADAPQQTRTPEDRPRPPRQSQGTRSMSDTQREEFRARLQKADSNADGKVSFSEAQTAFPQMTQERFNLMDRNHDGAIGPEDRAPGADKRKPQ
jgi:Ca2+-binding EF-hand superfamily protein